MPYSAPWLIPADPVRSASEGARLGLDYRGQNIGANEHEASLSQQASEFAQSQALDQEKIQGSLDEARQRTQLATTLAARKFQAQQQYQQAVSNGADPVQAMMQFGPGMGTSTAGLGSMALENFRSKQASMPPQAIPDPNNPGKTAGFTYGGQFHPVRQAVIPKVMNPVETETVKRLNNTLKSIDDQTIKLAAGTLPGTSAPSSATRALRLQREAVEKQLADIQKKHEQPADGETNAAPQAADPSDPDDDSTASENKVVSTQAGYDALPSGATYQDADGNIRKKK
jgi:hypothetical protein